MAVTDLQAASACAIPLARRTLSEVAPDNAVSPIPAAAGTTPSIIIALHQRYEANSIEYQAIDVALTEARRTDDRSKYRLEHAQDASINEANTLRVAAIMPSLAKAAWLCNQPAMKARSEHASLLIISACAYQMGQGSSVLSGLDCQVGRLWIGAGGSATVEAFCASKGWDLIAPPYTEVESGKRTDRPELTKAIERALLTRAKLVVSKWDRLTRDIETLVTLEKSGVDFVAADNPEANGLTIRLLVVIAQEEREAASRRTKDALAAAKLRGCKANGEPWKHGATRLGNPMGVGAFGGVSGALVGAETGKRKADERARRMADEIARLRTAGVTSLGGVAAALNEAGIVTARGGKWHASSVRNLLARL